MNEWIEEVLRDGWRYIARDADGVLKLHKSIPVKHIGSWVSVPGISKRLPDKTLLPTVKWTDMQPTDLRDLT